MKEIINKIKEKKPLDRLDDDYVKEFIGLFLKKDPKLNKKLLNNELKKKDFEKIVKNVRNELNKTYGQFWLDNNLDLNSHRSTKEREKFYSDFYKKIFNVTGKVNSILDLGAGLNPLTYKYINDYKNVYFYSIELTKKDCEQIKSVFGKDKIKGEIIQADLRVYNKFPKVDLCLMLKLVESLETNGHKLAEYLINSIKAKFIVVSFSTVDVKGRRMNYPRRGWIEKLLERLDLYYEIFEEHNEIFYVIKK